MPEASILKINGSTVDRDATRVSLNRCEFGIVGNEILEFTEECAPTARGSFANWSQVELIVPDGGDSVRVFKGRINGVYPSPPGEGCNTVGYRAVGLRTLANFFITNDVDLTGLVVYNMPRTDVLSWSPDRIGKTVGQILYYILEMHEADFTAFGIAIPNDPDSDPSSDLAALQAVPKGTVLMAGRILDACDGLLGEFCNTYQMFIDPDTLKLRVIKTTELPATTVNIDQDLVRLAPPPGVLDECSTKVVLRGMAHIEAGLFDNLGSNPGLYPAWDSADEVGYKPSDSKVSANVSFGVLNSMTDITLNITPDGSAPIPSWAENYWNGGTVWAGRTIPGDAASIVLSEARFVVSVEESGGGSCNLVVDYPFDGSGYDWFEVRGPSLSGKAIVYRKYYVRSPDFPDVGDHLVRTFGPRSFPFTGVDGVVVQTSAPMATKFYNEGCDPEQAFQGATAPFQVMPALGDEPGYILFDDPLYFGDNKACYVKALIPYTRGTLFVETEGWQGTAYTNYGMTRPFYRDYPDWVYAGEAQAMMKLAQELLDTVKDEVFEGSLLHYDCPLDLMRLGKSLAITNGAGDYGYEGLTLPITTVSLDWPDEGGVFRRATLGFSNRRKAFSGESLYYHPSSAGSGGGIQPGFQDFAPLPFSAFQQQDDGFQPAEEAAESPAAGSEGWDGSEPGFDPQAALWGSPEAKNTYRRGGKEADHAAAVARAKAERKAKAEFVGPKAPDRATLQRRQKALARTQKAEAKANFVGPPAAKGVDYAKRLARSKASDARRAKAKAWNDATGLTKRTEAFDIRRQAKRADEVRRLAEEGGEV